jgi:hypothetical protein
MTFKHLLLMSTFCLTTVHAESDCMSRSIIRNEISIGFMFGYVTGLVPVAGQMVFPMVGMFCDSPRTNAQLVLGSAVVGHVAGVATISAAIYYGIKALKKHLFAF